MLVSLRGTLDHTAPGIAVIDVGGVGFRVLIPASTAAALPAVGGTAKLLTHLVVREDALILYGFGTSAEIELFERLLAVNKLGPAKALALLSGSTPAALRADIVRGNATALMRIPGIGRTLAAQIILDLKEKLGPISDDPEMTEDADLLTWLQAMGFSAAQAHAAVKRLPEATRGEPLEDRVRVALSILRPD